MKKLQHADSIRDVFVKTSAPYTVMVYLYRDENNVHHTNVPHVCTQHSPAGYSWGYGGSGPSDLALNLCELGLKEIGYVGPRMKCWDGECYEMAYLMHQEFKWKYIAPLDKNLAQLPFSLVTEFVTVYVQEEQLGKGIV